MAGKDISWIAGLDGCKAGWIVVWHREGDRAAARSAIFTTFLEVCAHLPPGTLIGIDMPIGLPDHVEAGGRAPDRAARLVLGPRRSSVFSVPARSAVYAFEEGYSQTCAIARHTSSPPWAPSKQAFWLFPRIQEIDRALRADKELARRVFEIHPEVSFATMKGAPLHEPKKKQGRCHPNGMELRKDLLRREGFAGSLLDQALPRGVGLDDLLDACAVAWSAARIKTHEGCGLSQPAGCRQCWIESGDLGMSSDDETTEQNADSEPAVEYETACCPGHLFLPDRLVEGYDAFLNGRFAHEHRRFRKLAETGQSPKVLLIGCSDSRVSPEVIFDAEPGEIFVVRNIANLIPPYRPDVNLHDTSAALEFGVVALGVEHIVVMGHALCGGVRAFAQHESDPNYTPLSPGDFIGHWITLIEPAAHKLGARTREEPLADYVEKLAKASVIQGLTNLRGFPYIKDREAAGRLKLHGAYFGIADGILLALDEATGQFLPVAEETHPALAAKPKV